MNPRTIVARMAAHEELNFLLTNRIPRRLATRFMGWFSNIEQPLVSRASIALWKATSDLDLSDARADRFRSLRDCFTRQLKPGARPVTDDRDVLVSPSDGIVVACGAVRAGELVQAKGLTYALHELIGERAPADRFEDGVYVTLRLTATMYHRFHAMHDLHVERVTYIAGDTWNVNPPALQRIERLYCRNERAAIHARLATTGDPLMIVPVAAILVASIRLHFADVLLNANYRGARTISCDASIAKGEEMGWFEHGSTIVILAPRGYRLAERTVIGARVRMGEPLLRTPL